MSIYNRSIYEKIGDMSFRIPFASIGSSMEGFCDMFNITEDDLVYINDELTDETGGLLKDKVYVNMKNFINNDTDKTIEVFCNIFPDVHYTPTH